MPCAIAHARIDPAVASRVPLAVPADNRNNNARLPQAGD